MGNLLLNIHLFASPSVSMPELYGINGLKARRRQNKNVAADFTKLAAYKF